MTDTALIATAETLATNFRARADEFEQARRIPADAAAELGKAGMFAMGAPAALGGLESDPVTYARVIETLATGEASTAWISFIGATTLTSLALLPEDTARALYPDPATLITGVFAPTGSAEKVDGGFKVSGRWQWGSGSQNAAWVMGGCMLKENGEPMLGKHGAPMSHMAFLPPEQIEFIDTWHTSGLCGTGSLDYAVKDVFVPEEHMAGYLRRDRVPVTPLYAFPNFTFLALGIASVSLGIARSSITELVELAVSKKRVGARATVSEQQTAQIKLAEAEANLRSARLFFYDTIESAWELAKSGDPVSVEKRRDMRLATTNAVNKSVAIVSDMYDLGGGSAVYKNSRLQRNFRDVNVAKSHIMVAQQTLEIIGALFFGLTPNTSRL